MSNDQKIAELEELCSELMADTLMLQIAVKALMAAHPNPEVVTAALKVATAGHAVALQESGFSRGMNPADMQALLGQLSERYAKWLEYLGKPR